MSDQLNVDSLVVKNDKYNWSMFKFNVSLNNQRYWFLMNGTQRLNWSLSAKLAIWPEDDPNDDRILNQLMFVPENYDPRSAALKSIYLSATDNDWKLSLGRREFLKCPVSSCQLVPRVIAHRADLIFFKSRNDLKYFMANRAPNQIWAKFEIESPANVLMILPNNLFNWTVTYRHDSEISTPYYKFYPYEDEFKNTLRGYNYAANKTRKVAWFVSNCKADNSRLEYAHELSKYITLDIYGDCGQLECSKDDSNKCFKLLKDYKFYLSFENSNCLDYITEKFWYNGLMQNVLPIVMGAHPSTYKRLAPPNSYIHVDDYESPQHLAQYLNVLDKNDELYNKYFEWKGTGEIKQIYMWCRVCALLHAPLRYNVYENVNNWWNSKGICVKLTWTNMSIPDSNTTVL